MWWHADWRRHMEKLYDALIKLHTFTLRRRVKAAGSLVYLAGAVAAAIWRQKLRIIGQIWQSGQVKTVLNTLATGIGQVVEQAQGIFR